MKGISQLDAIEERVNGGTAMPSGFTNSLTRKELRDIISYLASLKPGKSKSALERK
jgi:mono/diheme cytochrome c family protein